MSVGSKSRVLLLTVGAGDSDNLEATLLAPLRKSISTHKWDRVLLLPSQLTRGHAERLQNAFEGLPVEVRPLPKAGMEDDPDACFGHFDSELARLIAAGVPPAAITVDFTRGTKAMSAALVLAAVGRGTGDLRYICGQRERGLVKAGHEKVRDFDPALVNTRRDLDRAREFLDSLQFAAVEKLFPMGRNSWAMGLYPERLRAEAAIAGWLGAFWGAWDRFDYRRAVELLKDEPPAAAPEWQRFVPSRRSRNFLERLAMPRSTDYAARASHTRDLVADLLANARRRIRSRQLEDALLRAYRALEMMGQARLFTHGLDTANLDRRRVAQWVRTEALRPDSHGIVAIGREKTASLLSFLQDDFGNKLLCAGNYPSLQPRTRNESILIHGLRAQTTTADERRLAETLDNLERLFLEEDPTQNPARLAVAQFPFAT